MADSAIAGVQLEQLRSLIAELFPGNRFYSQKLNALGITFDVESLEDFSARFPFTTKGELLADQLAHPPFGSNLTYPLDRYTRFHQTSGTAGVPLRWLDTAENWQAMIECWTEVFKAAGVRAGDRVFFAFSFGPFIGFWLAFESAARLGCLCLPGGSLSSRARLQAILENEASILCCTPTYAIRLGEVAEDEKLSLVKSKVRRIIVAGEPGGSLPAVRARLAELWPGATVFDHHGMTETGPVSFECSVTPGRLHIMEEAFYAEIMDAKSLKPVADSQPGELVLTTLQRTGSPVLRYRTGDLVRGRRGRCACGRDDLALDGGILGRVDDMVIIRGVNVYPGAVEEIVRACGGIAEYQVEISTRQALPEMTVRIEPEPQCEDGSALARKLEGSFATALALRVPVTYVATGTLPRSEMKSRRWLSR